MDRNNFHQVIVCTADAKRLAVLDVETKPQDNWVEHCAVVFGKWMLDNPSHKILSSHISNGNFHTWVTPLH